MRWYERVAQAIANRGLGPKEVGAALGVTPQNAGQKLQGKRGVSVDELKILADLAGMSVSEAVGDDAVVIDLEDEKDLIELYRLLNPEQKRNVLNLIRDVAKVATPKDDDS